MDQEQRKEFESLLKIIAGLEVSIRTALEERDYDVVKPFQKQRLDYYKKLRRIVYGLEDGDQQTEQEG